MRNKKFIKCNVDASFNRDSSIESENSKTSKSSKKKSFKEISSHASLQYQIPDHQITKSKKGNLPLASITSSILKEMKENVGQENPLLELGSSNRFSSVTIDYHNGKCDGDDYDVDLDRNSSASYNIKSSFDSPHYGDSKNVRTSRKLEKGLKNIENVDLKKITNLNKNEDSNSQSSTRLNFMSTPYQGYKKRRIFPLCPISPILLSNNESFLKEASVEKPNSNHPMYTRSKINTSTISYISQMSNEIYQSHCSINLRENKYSTTKKKSLKKDKKKKNGKKLIFAEEKYRDFLKKSKTLHNYSATKFVKTAKKNSIKNVAYQKIREQKCLLKKMNQKSKNATINSETNCSFLTNFSSRNETNEYISNSLLINVNESSQNISKASYKNNEANGNTINKENNKSKIIEISSVDTIGVINISTPDNSTSSTKKYNNQSK